jgi:hypothetical protein
VLSLATSANDSRRFRESARPGFGCCSHTMKEEARKSRQLVIAVESTVVLYELESENWIATRGLPCISPCTCESSPRSRATPEVTQAQMRHSDLRITLGIYGHVLGDAQCAVADKGARARSKVLRPNRSNRGMHSRTSGGSVWDSNPSGRLNRTACSMVGAPSGRHRDGAPFYRVLMSRPVRCSRRSVPNGTE